MVRSQVTRRYDLAACALALLALVAALARPVGAGIGGGGGGGALTIVSQDTMGANFATSSTTLVDVTDLTHTYTARAETVLVDAHVVLRSSATGERGVLTSNFNAVQVQELSVATEGASENDSAHSAIGQATSSGSIVHKVQCAADAGTLTIMSGSDASRLSVWGVR